MPMEKTICVTHINHCHLPRSTTHLGIVLWIRELPNCAMFTITLTESLEVADCWSRVGILPPLLYPFVSWGNSSSRPSASVVTSSQLSCIVNCCPYVVILNGQLLLLHYKFMLHIYIISHPLMSTFCLGLVLCIRKHPNSTETYATKSVTIRSHWQQLNSWRSLTVTSRRSC